MSVFSRLLPARQTGLAPAVQLGVYAGTEKLLAAMAQCQPGKRPRLSLVPAFEGGSASEDWVHWLRAHQPHSHSTLLLHSGHYRIVPMDAPRVPPEERRAAVRYQAQELLDFAIEDSTIDCLDVPSAMPGQVPTRVFVVAGMKGEITRWMHLYRSARLALRAVDIPEMALRNLSVMAAGEAAHIYLHVGLNSSRLVIVWQRELCAFRQFELSSRLLHQASDADIESRVEQLALDVQRTADAFGRQFHGADLSALWVSSVTRLDAVAQALGGLQSLPVKRLVIEDWVDWDGPGPPCDFSSATDHTLALGAALRAA